MENTQDKGRKTERKTHKDKVQIPMGIKKWKQRQFRMSNQKETEGKTQRQ
jgi:hypothetical protein